MLVSCRCREGAPGGHLWAGTRVHFILLHPVRFGEIDLPIEMSLTTEGPKWNPSPNDSRALFRLIEQVHGISRAIRHITITITGANSVLGFINQIR